MKEKPLVPSQLISSPTRGGELMRQGMERDGRTVGRALPLEDTDPIGEHADGTTLGTPTLITARAYTYIFHSLCVLVAVSAFAIAGFEQSRHPYEFYETIQSSVAQNVRSSTLCGYALGVVLLQTPFAYLALFHCYAHVSFLPRTEADCRQQSLSERGRLIVLTLYHVAAAASLVGTLALGMAALFSLYTDAVMRGKTELEDCWMNVFSSDHPVSSQTNEILCRLQQRSSCSGGPHLCGSGEYPSSQAAFESGCPYCPGYSSISFYQTTCAEYFTISVPLFKALYASVMACGSLMIACCVLSVDYSWLRTLLASTSEMDPAIPCDTTCPKASTQSADFYLQPDPLPHHTPEKRRREVYLEIG